MIYFLSDFESILLIVSFIVFAASSVICGLSLLFFPLNTFKIYFQCLKIWPVFYEAPKLLDLKFFMSIFGLMFLVDVDYMTWFLFYLFFGHLFKVFSFYLFKYFTFSITWDSEYKYLHSYQKFYFPIALLILSFFRFYNLFF